MKIYKVTDPEFREYGRIVDGYDVQPIVDALLSSTPLSDGVEYVPEDPLLQNLEASRNIAPALYGGLPVEFGWCNGRNTRLNCLEYHRSSEFNLPAEDLILLLARKADMEDMMLDTASVKAFLVPKGVLVEVYAATLHYAPCHADPAKGFRMMVALPRGTNLVLPGHRTVNKEDHYLTAVNKWLLAHPDSDEARGGAAAGLKGVNIDLALV